MTKQLRGEVLAIDQVSASLEERLYALHREHYDGADAGRFHADLREKQWVIVLREAATNEAVGFSTQMLLDALVEDRPVRALFSGDTIIHRDYWGSQELVRAWCRFAGALKACQDGPLFWFLISKGYRTYLYLPFFFDDFYPRHELPTPRFERQLIETLATSRFGAAFNPSSGLIEHFGSHDRLKPALDASPQRLNNPHVAFFLKCNPHHAQGVELACVAEIAAENMRGAARRALEVGMTLPMPGG